MDRSRLAVNVLLYVFRKSKSHFLRYWISALKGFKTSKMQNIPDRYVFNRKLATSYS